MRDEANGVTAYRVKGWPSDLADFDDGARRSPTERTLLRSGNNFLFGAIARARRSTAPRAGSRGP